jgi:L-fuconolactonase
VRDQDWITGPALVPLRRDFLLGEYRPLADANGVTAGVVVQTVTVPGETPELLALAATSELIAGVVGWTDLTAPGYRRPYRRPHRPWRQRCPAW